MKRSTTVIAVASGKGGVGKSIISVNLAEVLAASDHRTALVDVDFGQGACSILMNEAPAATLLDVVDRNASFEAACYVTTQGLTLVQGAQHLPASARHAERLYDQLDDALTALRVTHDFIVIDAPAGLDGPVRWALDRADLGILVLVGEPTAVADAYRLAKLIWQADPDYPLGAIVNFSDTADEAQDVARRFEHVTNHFTQRAPSYLGWLPYSPIVRRSVTQQRPAVRQPGSVRDALQQIAHTIVHGRLQPATPVS